MKNLYEISELYVDDSTTSTGIWYIYASNDEECFEYIKSSYGFMSEDKDLIMENKGEIDIVQDDYDSYYNESVYGWELLSENISLDEAKEYILKDMLTII